MSQIHYPEVSQNFSVEWGGNRLGFTEVSGLSIEVTVIPFTDGASPSNTPRKMPGQKVYQNIVLKRGIMALDNDFFNSINSIQLNKAERRNLFIRLLNEQHEPIVTWIARNAFPVKYIGPTLRANSSEIAIESLEFAHEGLTVEMS